MTGKASPATGESAIEHPSEGVVNQDILLNFLGYNCLQAYLTMAPAIKSRLAKFRLRPVDFTILSIVNANPDINQKRLAQTIKVSPPNLATLLDRLEQDALLTRQRNPKDKRSQILVLTAKGKTLCEKSEKAIAGVEDSPALSQTERQELLRLLQKVFLVS